MKNNLQIMLIAALGLIFFCSANGFAQTGVGGYKQVSTDDEIVIAAAECAANAQSDKNKTEIKIESIVSASRQVVAGTNYKICMQVSVADDEDSKVKQFVQTVIFYSLKREFSLKNWREVESCG